MIEQFAKDVDEGLSHSKKTLSSKYFYNKQGDELFIKIMNMPEYYLTRAEMEIFTQQSNSMIDCLELFPSTYFELIELGAGDGTKTRQLLSALNERHFQYDYIPVDISKNVLDNLVQDLSIYLPKTSVKPQHGDYFNSLHSLKDSHHPKVVLFLGSNIGNMPDDKAQQFLQQLSNNLNIGDKLLLGVDLIKPASVILPAYDDEEGITGAFNINLLERINNELDGSFDLDKFEHAPEYDEKYGIAKSYLKSKCDQEVEIKATGKSYQFNEGEKIHTEISRKYNDAILHNIIHDTSLRIDAKFTDSKHYFADIILTKR
jgi:dimethylhistidine N-methyltransferase